MSNPVKIRKSSVGFTLIEMMMALLIFAMLSVAGVLLLRSAADSSEVTNENLSEMAEMQRFVSLMEADLSQAVARSYRNSDGDRIAAFSGERIGEGNSFLSFTRGGNSNVNNRARSNLQRVEYRLNSGTLERLNYEMTDGGVISDPAPLLRGLSRVDLRFRDKGGLWLEEWRTERLSDLPRAIEIRFEQDGQGYRHVFLVGTGYL